MKGTKAPNNWLIDCEKEGADQSHSSDPKCRAIFYARTTSAALSVLGCFLVLFIIIVYKKYTRFTQRLVMYLLLPTFVISAASTYPFISDTSVSCEVAGFFMNWGTLSQRLIILCIVVHLLVFTFNQTRPKCLELLFHFVTWGLSFCFSIIPIPGHHYGSAGVWCWIKGVTPYEDELRLGCYYIWVWCCVSLEIVCFTLVVVRVRKVLRRLQGMSASNPEVEETKRRLKKYIYPLMLYPLVNFILAIPITANRIQNWVNEGHPVFLLFLCHSMVFPLWGFCNAMMYFMNKETLLQLHPYNVWESIISRRRGSSQNRQIPIVPNDQAPDVDHVYAGGAVTNPAALYSATMASESNME